MKDDLLKYFFLGPGQTWKKCGMFLGSRIMTYSRSSMILIINIVTNNSYVYPHRWLICDPKWGICTHWIHFLTGKGITGVQWTKMFLKMLKLPNVPPDSGSQFFPGLRFYNVPGTLSCQVELIWIIIGSENTSYLSPFNH